MQLIRNCLKSMECIIHKIALNELAEYWKKLNLTINWCFDKFEMF